MKEYFIHFSSFRKGLRSRKYDMPTNTTVLEKRMQIFLEHCKFKRQKSRMDVYMENLKMVSNKELCDLDGQDVLRFLICKRCE